VIVQHQRPLPSTGSSRDEFPGFIGTISRSDNCRPLASASVCPRPGLLPFALIFFPRSRQRHEPTRWFRVRTHLGWPITRQRRQSLPSFRGTPICTCPALGPRRDLHARPLRRFGAAFRQHYNVGSRVLYFEALSRGLCTRCLRFALPVARTRRKTRFRLLA